MDIKHKLHQIEEFERQVAVEQGKLERDAKREEVQRQLESAPRQDVKIRTHKELSWIFRAVRRPKPVLMGTFRACKNR